MVSFKHLFVAAALLTIGVLSAGVNVYAVSSGGVGGRPANPDPNNPRSQSIFIFTANKDEVKKDVILVSNNSDQKQTIDLYAVDGIVTNTGAYTCSQQSEAKQKMGGWITIDKPVVTLEAGKTEQIGFTLAMPGNADVGEHNGCIVFQLQNDKGKTSGNVRILTRQAVRVVATVPGDLHRSVDIQNFVVTDKDGKQTFDLSLKNSGNVSADVDAKVYLTSLFGGVAYQNGGGYPVLADQKLDLTFTNESKPFFGGWYYTQAKMTYDKRAGSFGVGDATNAIAKSSERRLVFVLPSVGGLFTLLLIFLAVAGAAFWYTRRRQIRRNTLLYGKEHTVKSGDTIQTIADKYTISWRQLASVNNIAAPYVLTEGSALRVPVKKQKKTKPSANLKDK
jgi:hypothetical protein